MIRAAFAALLLAAAVFPAAAQSSNTASRPAQQRSAQPPASPPQAAAPQQAPPRDNNPFSSIFGGSRRSGGAADITPEQRALIDRVSAYLSSITVLNGKFVQVGPDGSKTQGNFYLQKPGRVRFEYDAPSPIELVADGESVVVRDRRLATQDLYPLSQTPLRFLLSDRVNLLRDTNLMAVYADDVFVTAVVEERSTLAGTSRLMLMFDAKNMQLKQWTVTDPQGYDTTVAVYDLDSSKKPDPAMFRIDYTRAAQ